mmetsp:Transcript_38485/g.100897  ORF Transcript_38485/g.100897 Transcript_38485/m.100897 type:complete len:275 (+) Transcript_38485:29-853(+)
MLRSAVLRACASVRGWNGGGFAKRPEGSPHEFRGVTHPDLVLYEYEASPWCRRVRETLCVLDLEHTVRPCPRDTLRLEGAYGTASRYKAEVTQAGGRLLFPFLHDRTAGVALNQSAAIVAHLWEHYGLDAERPPLDGLLNGGLPKPLDFAALVGPSALRLWAECGLMLAPSRPADAPLVLHGCEPDGGTRLLREKLCMLQLAYRYKPRAASPGAAIPHLEDPNTGWASFGARDGLAYLEEAYQIGPCVGHLAGVPEPNLGDPGRTSWISSFLRP